MKINDLLSQSLLILGLSVSALGSTVFISEIHYDNAGADVDETVEVYIQSGTSLTDVTLSLYNGNGGTVYESETADQLVIGGTVTLEGVVYDIYTWTPDSIQNGAPDGVSVDVAGVVSDFVSYEGALVATAGPAAGTTALDIGVAETSSTTTGSSLELTDSGWVFADDGTNSFTAANTDLTTNPLAVPEPSSALLGSLGLLCLLRRRR